MFNFIKIGKTNTNVYLKGGIRMVLVLIFLIIFIIITLFLFLVTASNLRFSLENLEVSNTKKTVSYTHLDVYKRQEEILL